MAIVYPRADIFTTLKLNVQTFKLISRQEQSRTPSGETKVKDFGPGIWKASWGSIIQRHDIILDWEAMLNSLQNGIHSFYGGDLRREYPKEYPTGAFTDSGVIASLPTNNKSLSLSGLSPGFKITRGDYLSFLYASGTKQAFHQAMESVTANGSGTTAAFEVQPFIRSGAVVATAVKLKKPVALWRMDPGSLEVIQEDAANSHLMFSAYQVFKE